MVRPVPPPGVALAAEIRAALRLGSWPRGFDPRVIPRGAPEWMADRCLDVGPRNIARCTYGPRGATTAVAVLGDSVAVGWMPALRRAPALRDSRISVLTRRQCANIRGFVTPSCAAHQDWAIGEVRRLRPELAILSARYQGGQTWQQWQAGTRRMLTELAPYVGRIVVLAPPPDSDDPRACFQRGLAPRDCVRTVSRAWSSYAYAEHEAAKGAAAFLDSRPWFCVAERCPALIAGIPVTFDGRHLTGAYAARLGPAVSAALD